jgi:hypothetical protein
MITANASVEDTTPHAKLVRMRIWGGIEPATTHEFLSTVLCGL